MFADLDDPSGRDPVRVGSKAAALAAARAAGAAVLPGFVVEGSASLHHLRRGAGALSTRGSGGARLVVSGEPISFSEGLVAAGSALGHRLVARSSTLLEASGEWSGAFTSYVDIAPHELPKAVAGCWASVFTVAALERQEAAGIEPGSFPVSVLIQPALQPEAGGWARLEEDGSVAVYGIKGSPAPLLQGWETGLEARWDGRWAGDELIEAIGIEHLDEIVEIMSTVAASSGANRCEWALSDRVWALQVGRVEAPAPAGLARAPVAEAQDLLASIEAVVLAPGRLGEDLVLPWAIAGVPEQVRPSGPSLPVGEIEMMSRELTEEVWGLPWARARQEAAAAMISLRGVEPSIALTRLRSLRPPDPGLASRLLGALAALRAEMVDRGAVADEQAAWHLSLETMERVRDGGTAPAVGRLGTGGWEPLVASVLLSAMEPLVGVPAAPGLGAGLRSEVEDAYSRHPGRRQVITATHPVPNLASLIWDASGLVTRSGSPAAHLFEAARALRVPAVCGVELGPVGNQVVAVDGVAGHVAIMELTRSF